jgi:aminopeptidase N
MPSLSRDEAVARAALIRVHAYAVDLDLSEAADADRFASTTTVRFTCTQPGAGTFVEIKPVELHEVRLNGVAVDVADLAENRLALTDLRADNELVVRSTMAYSNTGEGLHRFVDPADGQVYLYAQTCLDDAQRIFACFDQPDLKASLQLSVTAPPGWLVAANGSLAARPERDRWEFAPTEPISTYIVTLIAGRYHVVRAEHDGIPLALYSRASLAAHLDREAPELFEVTAAAFDRFHELFGLRYPFGKYDQAFVPEFNAGAMENAGLVTFRDEFLFPSAVTEMERELRAVVVAHEMAHMWFGDLVTMVWWDDLWLNESFAEYMGFRVAAEATRFSGAWTTFAVGRKAWGYAADQRPSTHPIAPDDVADTGLAMMNFDGISYAKGASALRQLVAWLGDEAFLAGIRTHFAKHGFANATLADLLEALTEASGRDVRAWAQVWLRRPQVNTLRPTVVLADDGRYERVTVEQSAPAEYPTLRPHRINIGVYSGLSSGEVTRTHSVEVDLAPEVDSGQTIVDSLAGVPAGELLLLNDGDFTFAKIRFDPASRDGLSRVLPRLRDPLARALVWAAAVDATRDGELPSRDFLTLVAAALPTEEQVGVLGDVLNFARGSVCDRFLPGEVQATGRSLLGQACRVILVRAEAGSGRQLMAARGFIAAAGPSEVDELRSWLDGVGLPRGLVADGELRWSALNRLVTLGAAGEAEIAEEYARDPNARAAEHAARGRALRPDASAKAEAWGVVMEDTSLSNRLVLATAEGFWRAEQVELTESYVPRYFAEVAAMTQRRTPQVAAVVAAAAYPSVAVAGTTLAAARDLLVRDDIGPMLRRVIVDATDELSRALVARTNA